MDCGEREALLAEYNTLRTEILQQIQLHNSLIVAAYTASAAILTVAAMINEH